MPRHLNEAFAELERPMHTAPSAAACTVLWIADGASPPGLPMFTVKADELPSAVTWAGLCPRGCRGDQGGCRAPSWETIIDMLCR